MRMLRLISLLVGAGMCWSAYAKQPNILLIVAEDLSPRIGAYGDKVANTPNIDALAGQGIRFTNVYAAAGVCAPNRSALISGMYPISMGTHMMRTSSLPLPSGEKGYEAVPPAQMKAFPELLRRAGYATANFAKKDYQFGEPFSIWDIDTGNYLSPVVPDLWNQLPKDKPFFVMMNLMATHEGHLIAPDAKPSGKFGKFFEAIQQANKAVEKVTNPADVAVPPYYPDTAEVRQSIAQFYDNIHHMDKQVGDILKALKAQGLDKDTIVLWTTDHGDALPRAKRSVYDTGLLIPLIVRFPDGKGAGSVNDKLISMVDFAPTFLDFAGAPLPAFLQGIDIFSQQTREYIYGARDRMDLVPDKLRAVRDTRYKYIHNEMRDVPYFRPLTFRDSFPVMQSWWHEHSAGTLNAVQDDYFSAPRPEHELYDTSVDPWEINNIASNPQFADKLTEMQDELADWKARVHDKSNVDELVMVEDMWPEFKQPVTESPVFTPVTCGNTTCLSLTSDSENASLSYRVAGQTAWQLYVQPIPVTPHTTLEAKAIRYGYKESAVEHYTYE